MKRVLRYLVLFILLYSCANPVSPTGGDKDVEAPILLANKPLKGSTNLKDGKIELFFDEYFQLSRSEDKILITPPMLTKPKFVVKGKKLIIKLPDDLIDNTTYNITFFGAISDYNENNSLEYLSYVFSTGDKIDSSSLSGTVKLASTNKTIENATVGLYLPYDTGVLTHTKPRYIAKTNASGQFKLEFIKSGLYKLAVLKEENNNLLYDNNSERVSLVTNPINIIDNVVLEQDIYAFVSEPTLKVLDFELLGNYKLAVAFSKYVDELALDIDTYHENDVFYFNKLKDTLYYHWFDTSITQSNFYFTLNNKVQDTLELDYRTNSIDNTIRFSNKEHFANQEQVISFPFIISRIDTSKIQLKDSLNQIKYDFNINKEKLFLSANLAENMPYTLIIDSGAVQYFNELTNESTNLLFKTKENVSLGSLILNLNYESNPGYVMHLLDKSGLIIAQMQLDDKKTVRFNKLKQGNYTLKVFIDRNQNLLWDTGSFKDDREAESYVFYMENIEIKNNWDKDLQINF